MWAMRNSLPFMSPWPFATTAENDSRNSFTSLLESTPAGAVTAVSAAPGADANSFSPSAFTPARVISAASSALSTRALRPATRSPFPIWRMKSRAAPRAANSDVAGV